MPHTLRLPLRFLVNTPAEDIRIRQSDLEKTLRKLQLDLQKGRDKLTPPSK